MEAIVKRLMENKKLERMNESNDNSGALRSYPDAVSLYNKHKAKSGTDEFGLSKYIIVELNHLAKNIGTYTDSLQYEGVQEIKDLYQEFSSDKSNTSIEDSAYKIWKSKVYPLLVLKGEGKFTLGGSSAPVLKFTTTPGNPLAFTELFPSKGAKNYYKK